jgi:hypothetical protein
VTLEDAWAMVKDKDEDCAQEAARYTLEKDRDDPGLYFLWCFARHRARRFEDGRVPDRRKAKRELPDMSHEDTRLDGVTPELLCLIKEELLAIDAAHRVSELQRKARRAERQRSYRQRLGASRGQG